MIKMVQTSLICPECASIFPIMRRESDLRKQFHIKTIYCPTCKNLTDHIEIRNLDIMIEQISNKEETRRKDHEQKVYELAKKRGV